MSQQHECTSKCVTKDVRGTIAALPNTPRSACPYWTVADLVGT